MSNLECIKEACVRFKNGFCLLKDPERYGDVCLDYQDVDEALSLQIVFKKASLSLWDD